MNNELKKLIALRIKHLREKNGLTQEAFGEKIGVDTTTVGNIENGKTFPSFETICKIAYAFNLEPNNFFDFINYHSNKEEIINMLLLEHLRELPLEVKQKALEFIEVLAGRKN